MERAFWTVPLICDACKASTPEYSILHTCSGYGDLWENRTWDGRIIGNLFSQRKRKLNNFKQANLFPTTSRSCEFLYCTGLFVCGIMLSACDNGMESSFHNVSWALATLSDHAHFTACCYPTTDTFSIGCNLIPQQSRIGCRINCIAVTWGKLVTFYPNCVPIPTTKICSYDVAHKS